MLSVLILTRYDRLGASSRVRFLQFLPTLVSRGMKFSVQPFLGNDYIEHFTNASEAESVRPSGHI
jgi:hypothetical protein